MTWQLRAATLADVPAIVPLVHAAYRGEASRVGWTTEADLLDGPRTDAEDVTGLIARAHSQVLVAEQASRLEGCAHIAFEDGAGYFGMFAVLPPRQGGGLGAALLAEAERRVRDDWGAAEMRMTVIDLRVDLIPYYERRGYVRTGVMKPFPYGNERFGIPRRFDLRFEVLAKSLR